MLMVINSIDEDKLLQLEALNVHTLRISDDISNIIKEVVESREEARRFGPTVYSLMMRYALTMAQEIAALTSSRARIVVSLMHARIAPFHQKKAKLKFLTFQQRFLTQLSGSDTWFGNHCNIKSLIKTQCKALYADTETFVVQKQAIRKKDVWV